MHIFIKATTTPGPAEIPKCFATLLTHHLLYIFALKSEYCRKSAAECDKEDYFLRNISALEHGLDR